ncbi:acyl-CoA dehydrogenase family protein [Sulfobacillus harzensis]|uniref:Acyl-CoA/acyl-ACP dehydrogenase n=1 Tax=Sulfobacillus harzensis TaxID=2729629 RepID=A0A7Y0Q454_9FIRM|nr:acyl-CoA dehydrogenase family protein [Sulfobacillus harzensis]NMP23656.1 acyl-CoA/acyl-ACP dehydrogenase [Sulfobacillus harzensis]
MNQQESQVDEIRRAVRQLCAQFPEEYWRDLDERHAYPEEFIRTLTRDGWLSILIPEEYDGSGLGILEAAVVLEEINRSGGNAAPGHAQMYTMGAILRHGSPEQKQRWLPGIASGDVRLQAFGITEPTAGSDTTNISTFAERQGDYYHVRGQKIFISRVQHSDLMLLITRTTPRDKVLKKTDGLTLMVMDLREQGDRVRVKPIRTMINHETNEVFFDDALVPVENRIGEEGKGFRYLLSGVNAERILVGSECLGDGQYFVDKAVEYAGSRHVFGRPIGQNQGVQFPIAQAYMDLQAAILMRNQAAALFTQGQECGAEANMTKYLASEASWKAANAAMMTFGGYGIAVDYHIERKFREARLPLVAPISNNLVLSYVAQHVLGMPRSY